MDALRLLQDDHRKMKKMLDEGEDTTERAVKTRGELLERITRELQAHERIEEEILYPALKEHAQAKEIVLEGYQEHHVADLLIRELHETDFADERWGAKFSVLKENIEHHIEEEEGEMFKKARKLLEPSELESLGERMAEVKKETLRK
jgi:hypothetical protein